MHNYQCHITINNRTDKHLIFEKSDLPWGEFRDDGQPVRDIPPKTEVRAFVAQGAIGPAGCEGTVVYRYQDDANIRFTIYYDVPTNPLKDNKVEVTSSNENIAVERKGFNGKGNLENCTIKIVDGR
jgi:hypothetical protein